MYRVPPRRGAGGRLEEHAVEQVFEIVISSCENCTWQGTLRAGGEAVPFQSELELLVDKDIWPVPTYGDLMFEV